MELDSQGRRDHGFRPRWAHTTSADRRTHPSSTMFGAEVSYFDIAGGGRLIALLTEASPFSTRTVDRLNRAERA